MPKPYDIEDARFDAEQHGKCPTHLSDDCGCCEGCGAHKGESCKDSCPFKDHHGEWQDEDDDCGCCSECGASEGEKCSFDCPLYLDAYHAYLEKLSTVSLVESGT